MNMTTQINTYGKCPQCGGEGLTRERRPNGNDKCVNGHTYPSASALSQPNEPIGEMKDNGVTWYKQNPHAYPIGTKFYTSPPNTSELEQANKLLEAKCEELEENNITQLAAISTAAIGYFKDGDSILPEYDTGALRDVTSLYATYADLTAKLEKMREALANSRKTLNDVIGNGLTCDKIRMIIDEALEECK